MSVDKLVEALRKLMGAYVNLLDAGREKILEAGGSCDSVERMADGSPVLREARQALAQHEAEKQEPDRLAKLPLACDIDYCSGSEMGYAEGWNDAIDAAKEAKP